MEFSSTEPRLSSYLHARACRSGTPLAGNFELTARCNFNCKMCYVHLTAEEQQRRGRELTADEWLAIAQEARSRGMLFLLLTGGEPLIRKDFRYLLTELKKMGLLVSVNSNGSLIDRDWLDFFRHEPPFRFNITLYGASDAAYERLCGRPMFARVTENIRHAGAGRGGKAERVHDAVQRGGYGGNLSHRPGAGHPHAAGYLHVPAYPAGRGAGRQQRPVHRLPGGGIQRPMGSAAADPGAVPAAQAMKQGLALPSEDDVCDGTPGEGVACRAGRSAFWINWQGGMTPCGMMTQPLFSVPELGFAQAWERTRAATERIRLPGPARAAGWKEICHACAAMCVTETGHFDTKPEYVCEMTHETVRRTIEEAENGNS